MSELIRTDKRKNGTSIFWLLGIFVLGGAFFFIAGREFSKGDVSPFDIVLAAATMLVAGLLGWSFVNEPTSYTLYDDKLELKYSIRKPRIVLFSDITAWEEQQNSGKHGDQYSLTLHTPSSKVTIRSNQADSYEFIKAYATKNKPKRSA